MWKQSLEFKKVLAKALRLNLDDICIKPLSQVTRSPGVANSPPTWLTHFPFFVDQEHCYPPRRQLSNPTLDLRIDKEFSQHFETKRLPLDVETGYLDVIKNPVQGTLNTNLKDLMIAYNNVLGFNLFNCPKTFIVFVSLAQGFSVAKTMQFLQNDTLGLIKYSLPDAFIQPLLYKSGRISWVGTAFRRCIANATKGKPLNTYLHQLL
jgi:hypothetical protein